MSSYGGYQRTSYGAQGGEEGGGFMGASQQGSQSGEKRNYADDTLRPVTIKQLVDCKEPYPGAELAVDGVPTTQVSLIGQVRSVNPQAVNITYRIDDGTGMIDVKKWIDADKADDTAARFATDTYVRVFGRLQSFNGKRHVGAHYIRAIDDFNEVNYHLLEATYVHLTLTKGAPGTQQGGGGGDGMFVDGDYGGGGGMDQAANQARLASCSRDARIVYHYLASQMGEPVHVSLVAANAGLQASAVIAAANELVDNGMIYSTEDDTWAVMEF